MLLQNLLKIEFCLIAQLPSTNPCTKPMGFFRQEEEEKKNQNKNNSFSASLKRAEKPKIYIDVKYTAPQELECMGI